MSTDVAVVIALALIAILASLHLLLFIRVNRMEKRNLLTVLRETRVEYAAQLGVTCEGDTHKATWLRQQHELVGRLILALEIGHE